MEGKSQKDLNRAVAKIHGRAWADPEFRARLKKDPHSVLREHGLHAPDGLKIHVHESSPTDAHFVIPANPKHGRDGTVHTDYCSIAPDYCSDHGGDDLCCAQPDYCSDSEDCVAPVHPDICSI